MPDNTIHEIDFDLPYCSGCGEFNFNCQKCVDLLPKLTDTERHSMSSLGNDFIPRLFLSNAIASSLVEKSLIPESMLVDVASAICTQLNGRVIVKTAVPWVAPQTMKAGL